ncbi:hypothetical protein BBP40_012061 [Aspergillus hancockii]|nr:hypothetical protein BBP40_012061 [Aspergillus hancockii]
MPLQTQSQEPVIPVPNVAVDWDSDAAQKLEVIYADRADNTSEFTRNSLRDKIPRRYFDVKMSFAWENDTSAYLRVNDAIIPYVPPRGKPKKGGAPSNNYGKGYVYASFHRVLLDRIVNTAASHGYRVHPGDPKMPSTDEDWWITLNISEGARIKMERKKGAGHTDTSLGRLFMASKKGIAANVILSLKLKCSVEEHVKEDGTYYDHDEPSPAMPDEDTVWTLSSSVATMYVTDIDIDAMPPARETRSAAAPPQSFVTTEADAASDDLAAKLKRMGI